MKDFSYIKPAQLGEAVSALKECRDPCLFAGGTDLLVGMKHNLIKPDCIIDLKGIPGLDSFELGDDWRFGALTRVRDVETSKTLQKQLPFLCQAAGSLGSTQVRNKATIGGNLCNASPAGDMATMFLAMDTRLVILSEKGQRQVGVDEFFQGPNLTVLKRDDILTEIRVPREIKNFRGLYLKFSQRKAMDIGMVNMALLLETDSGGTGCKTIRIALGAVAPTPIRARQAEKTVQGQPITSDLIRQAAELAADEARPISDFRASAHYRKALVRKLVEKGLLSLYNESRA